MFSSSAATPPSRRLNAGGAVVDDAGALRVMPTTGDPTDEVRASLASLTARAQRLVTEKDAEPLLRNGYGLYEASRKAAEEARQQATRCQSTSEGYAPATHASVELFMTQHLGFDAQAQHRLLQQLQHRQAQLGADLGPMDALSGATDAAGFPSAATDVEAIVAELKNEILLDVQNAVHRRQTNLVRDQVDTLFKAAWHPYYVQVADDFEALSMSAAELAMSKTTGGASPNSRLDVSSATGNVATSSLMGLLSSDATVATELNRRITTFAAIVERCAPKQWVSCFAGYAAEAALDVADELTVLWATVAQLLESLERRGAEADAVAYVAASRRVMERKALSRVLERILRLDPLRFEDAENMSAASTLDVVARYCGTANAWMHAFAAMRSGRYDVAQLAVQTIGINTVTAAMKKLAAAAPMTRNSLPPALELQPLYAEPATKEDPYRQAVLLLLLAGRTGESNVAVLRTVLQLAQRITDSLEDALWLRLSCIRGVEESAQVSTVQSLRALQRAVLDDMQELVALTQGSACRLASFLIHALLPSTGLRLLMENNFTLVDGLHMALCFNAQNLLRGGLQSSLETPIDLARHVTRYSSVILLEVDRRTRASAFAGAAMFSYFYKTGLTQAFVECCLKDTIYMRLLGPRNAIGGQDALLLSADPGPLSEALLDALLQVAEAASSRNEVAKATHVLLAVVFLANQLNRQELPPRALLRAVQMLSSAVAQVLSLPPQSPVVADILSQAAQLQQALKVNADVLVPSDSLVARDYEAFAQLCSLADVYVYAVDGNVGEAIETFWRLPLVPAANSSAVRDVDTYVEAYVNAPGCVQMGITAILPAVLSAAGQLMQVYARSRANGAVDAEQEQSLLLEQMTAVCDWARQCCARTSVSCPPAVDAFARTYLR